MRISTETVYEVWNDTTGEHFAIGEDRDGLGMVEIRRVANNGIVDRISFTVEEAEPVAIFIERVVADLKAKGKK